MHIAATDIPRALIGCFLLTFATSIVQPTFAQTRGTAANPAKVSLVPNAQRGSSVTELAPCLGHASMATCLFMVISNRNYMHCDNNLTIEENIKSNNIRSREIMRALKASQSAARGAPGVRISSITMDSSLPGYFSTAVTTSQQTGRISRSYSAVIFSGNSARIFLASADDATVARKAVLQRLGR